MIWHWGLDFKRCSCDFCYVGWNFVLMVCYLVSLCTSFAWILAYWLGWNWKSLIMSCGLVVNWYMWFGVGIHSWVTWYSYLILFFSCLMVWTNSCIVVVLCSRTSKVLGRQNENFEESWNLTICGWIWFLEELECSTSVCFLPIMWIWFMWPMLTRDYF